MYLQVQELLERRIGSGELKAGDRIPTEKELVEKLGVSIITVRRAVTELCKKGLLIKQQGRGTFVCGTLFVRDSSSLISFSESCRLQGAVPGARLLEAGMKELDPETAAVLKQLPQEPGPAAEPGDQPVYGVYLSRLRTADGFPVVIENNWFGRSYAWLLQEDLNDRSLYDCLKARMGISIVRADKEIGLCGAGPEEAEILKVPPDTQLIMIRETVYSQTGEPVYVGTQLMNGQRFTLRIRQGV